MQIKLTSFALSLCLLNTSALANDPFGHSGTAVTVGDIVYNHDISSISHNPAASSAALKGGSGFVFNMLPPIGGGYEVGQIDSLLDELDELIDILEDDDLSAQDALDAKDRFDPFLENAGRNGLVKLSGHAGFPILPALYVSSELGTFSFNAQFSGSIRSTVIDDNIDIVGFNDSFKINTAAAVYVKSAGLSQVSLGYSDEFWQHGDGQLFAGATLNINRLSLSKNLISLAGLEDGEDIGDAIEDDYENNEQSSTQIGVDIGALWVHSDYHIGLSISDLNEPEYEYKSLNSDCSQLSGISLDNCIVTQDAISQGRVRANEIYTANAQATLSASAWLGESKQWQIHTSLDLNDKNDPIGDIYQWANIATTAHFDNWLIPGIRLGYSTNLVGSELSYYNIGVTLFKRAQLDLRWSDESVDIDGTEAPRSAFISFSIQSQF
ncbi:MAG: conjugal transfer protein TraF [Glaciecola sp.]